MDTYYGIVAWFDLEKQYGCLLDCSGASYIFKLEVTNGYFPQPLDTVSFGIQFGAKNAYSRSDYTITSVNQVVDMSTVIEADVTALNKAYGTYQKERQKKLRRREQERDEEEKPDYVSPEYRSLKGKSYKTTIQSKYGITPLKNRWAD